MTTQLIKLQDKFILVSDEEKTNGDECIHLTTFNRSIHHDIDNNLIKWWKIISENPDFSLLSEEDCKAIGFVDVEKLAKQELPDDSQWQQRFDFIKGFNKAQSLNDKIFSLDDIDKAIEYGRSSKMPFNEDWYDDFIQSLQQTSWDVEVEMEEVIRLMSADIVEKGGWSKVLNTKATFTRPKITNNSIKVLRIL